MQDTGYRAIAIVGTGAVLPDAPNVAAFWKNITTGRYSVSEVPPDRWKWEDYYDADRKAPDKTYSKIGGWVREFAWEPLKWRLPIPPRVSDAMDDAQRWAISCTREALADYGYPDRPLNTDRTAVILGNAMGGERHYHTVMRAHFPEYANELDASATFAGLPEAVRRDIKREWHNRLGGVLPPITEDTMPGELSNCLAGRIANLFNFRGANFVCDAACASTMAAISAAAEGLIGNQFDVVVTGGIDRNMSPSSFVKFCKIGALSATGTRPYAEGADGFVMGEGAAVFLMKRLADAERDGDKIYAVLRGISGSSDGKGKGITAPNPIGQKICIERAWQTAGLSPVTATLIEGHGTSTSVGDVVEVESMIHVLREHGVNGHSIALSSVKSNIGHLKSAAAAAAILKTVLSLREKVLPPSVGCAHPNPNIDFAHSPLAVNKELRPWTDTVDGARRAGVSAFGFGGTNFHAVLEEYIPHKITGNGKRSVAVGALPPAGREPTAAEGPTTGSTPAKAPLRGALVAGAASGDTLAERLRAVQKAAETGRTPAVAAPLEADLRAPERVAIDYGNAAELADKCGKALKALAADQPAVWKALRAQGIYRGHGPAPKVAFLYTGQGSQYANMMRGLRDVEPIVAGTFAEADRIMTPLLGKPLSEYIFVDSADAAKVAQAEEDLRQTEITQPAVLAIDLALTRLLDAYGIRPDMTMGHSLGEYGALVAAGALPFDDSLEAVSARGRGMTQVAMADNGRMAAVFAPLGEVERILGAIDGYVVIANYNSEKQSVIGGASAAVEQAMAAFLKAGFNVVPLPVSHAFHTTIVGGASEPLKKALDRLRLAPAKLPVVANVDGEFYPTGPDARPAMLDILGRQVASPVQFIKGLRTLFNAGARVFVEVGPKKALHGFVEDILGDRSDVLALFTNHPKFADTVAFNNALCGLYASGLGAARVETEAASEPRPAEKPQTATPVVITGASLGLPGTERIFDDGNVARMLAGEQFIHAIPARFREAMLDKHITRLMKSDNGGATFDEIRDTADVIKLAARGGAFDLAREFGVSAERIAALDRVTQLAMAAGIDALRDAGIPLTMRYKTTTTGTQLPERWGLPDALRDDTGVIFASVFPGYDSLADELGRYYSDRARREQLSALEQVRDRMNGSGEQPARQEIERRIAELKNAIEQTPYHFDRRFLFHVLSMGHSQFAELIGARGPNTQVNAACASTTMAVGLAEDWIHSGRCRRVVVISADDITSDHLIEWFGAGFLASGAAATDEVVEDAALPFDRRRHGMILGMGAAALVVESAEAARERGLQPICEVLAAVTANSAFHGTRLDVRHIGQMMETLVSQAEARGGVRRDQFAPNTVFISHETYTPARGGSASAEIHALRRVFGEAADSIVIANTKGFTGHAMGTGIEDVVAVKALETGCVPPVANFKEIDPELGALNLSKGGKYPVEFALRLGAGFGSQISMTLLRRVGAAVARPAPDALGYAYRITDRKAWQQWLDRIAGRPAQLEVVERTLRVHDPAVPAKPVVKVETVERVEKPAVAVEVKPAAPVKAVAATPAIPAGDAVKQKLLDLVAEKTGYPKDMLALDLDLEADLGVDTVKQAEMFAAIREAYGIPRDPNMKLRDFPTLGHVIQFVYDHRPDLLVKAAAPAPAPVTQADDVKQKLLDLVAEKTGYPKDMLALDLDLEADLGVDTVKQAEMFAAIREAYGIPRDPNMKLRDFPTLGHVIQFVYDHRPELQVKAAAPAPVAAAEAGDVKQKLLDLVAEKTGYPKDMLALDLDLEADLGVDTVKQAEMFAAIREAYSIPRDPNMKLRDFPTLGHVIQFVYDHRPDLQVNAAAPAPVAAAEAGDVKQKLLDLVAEKTGYPKDMLALDLDLEADLGVDTVKQAEMFAAIRDAYGIPRDPNMKLRDFPTLGHVIQFVYDHRPDLNPAAAPAPAPVVAVEPRAPVAQVEDVKQKLLDLVAEKTGYPKDMLALDLDLEADLGVDTVKQAEMFAAIREAYGIPRDPNMKLRDFPTLGRVIQFVYDHRPDLQVKAAAPPPQAAAADDDAIRERVLDIVAEKTGYPKEMLDPDLDLEADLGIDTVKQAEMFASVRAAFDIPRDTNMKLRDFPTLAHVVRFALEKRTVAAPPASPEPAPAPVAKPAPVVLANFEACERIPRRVPVPALRPALDRCKPTGVVLGPGKRVLVMADRGGAGDALAEKLRVLGVEVLGIDQLTAGPVDGVYWLRALDHEGDLKQMSIETWRAAIDARVKLLYRTMRSLYGQIAAPGTFLVSATRLGGRHGYDDAGATSPLGGAVTGFTKTYKREQPDVLVKAVDFETGRAAVDIADLLIAETLRDPGAVEIGHAEGQRWTVGLEERPAGNGEQGMTLDKNTVFVVTGAAGSIVSAITTDLAKASGGTFHLLDLIPEPDPSNPDLKRFVTDKDGLKRDLFARIQARGERATPAMVERELAGLERAQAAQTAIDAVRAAGGTAYYYGVNMTDGEAVARVVANVRERSGRIDVLLHAAGIERSHALPDKDPREFDLVFDVKSDGCFHLLRAIGDMPLRSIVGFSSIAGRFGNAGQADYSAANDLFCKIASSFRTTRPATRALAIDWTAWGGIGMATRGSIPKVMEMAGIDMLPPQAGVPWIRRELTAGGNDGEVVVAGKLGVLLKEWDRDGGLEQSRLPRGPMTSGAARMDLNGRLTIETSLDPKVQGFLRDHAIDGTPLLPGVMGIEAFAETAVAIAPGWHVEAVEDVDFLAPLKFYRSEPRTVTVAAEFHPENGGLVARCGLTGERNLPNQASPQVTTHFTGRVRLAKTPRETAAGPVPGSLDEPAIQSADIYRLYFHGPAYQVLKRAWCMEKGAVGEYALDLPEHHQPGDLPLAIAPRLIELCFQTAGLWEMAVKHRMGLPRHVDSVWLCRTPQKTDGPLYAVVTADPAAECFAADVVDAAGTRYLHLSGYRTVTLRENVDAPLVPIAEPVMLNA
jgi:acyl transferase domain-containing protein/acyl carrier protein/NAD(P)-dependent dehydrogenase (short-subunit alcohol dehydrogenase family)